MQKRSKYFGISLIVIIFILVKLAFVFKPYLIGWDESVYIGMGKFIFSGGEVGLWEDIRPPGLPLLLGFGWKLGFNQIDFGLAVELLFSIGCIILVYLITKKLDSKWAALSSAAVLAITPVFFENSSHILSSIPAAFFILLCIYLVLTKKHPFFVGLVVGMAFLARFPAVLIGFVLALYLICAKNKKRIENIKQTITNFFIFIFGGLVVTIPFFIFNYVAYRPDTGSWMDAVLRPLFLGSIHQNNPFNAVSGSMSNLFFYIIELVTQNPLLIFGLIGLFLCVYKKKSGLIILPLAIFFIYFTFIINKQVRFALVFLPFISILTGIGIYHTIIWLGKRKHSVITLTIVFILIGFMFSAPIKEDKRIVEWLIDEPHPLDSFYKVQLNGPVLTTVPMLTAHSEELFFPAYDNPDIAISEYNKHKDEVNTVVWFSGFYPCLNELCKQKKAFLKENIESDFSQSYTFSHNNEEYIVFS